MATDSPTSAPTELEAFYSFVGQSLKQGEREAQPEAVLRKWRAEREQVEVCEDIRQGIADMEAGLGVPAEQVFSELRRKYGIVDP